MSNQIRQEKDRNSTKIVSQKWGFGMAPPKPKTQEIRMESCNILTSILLYRNLPRPDTKILDSISEVKGLFNRIAREDQWDWFTVCAQLGYPSRRISEVIAQELQQLRSAIKMEDQTEFESAKNRLLRLPTRKCMSVFLGHAQIKRTSDTGWIYILSTRELGDMLKIGMTTRSVEQRVSEINSATGVAIPFGVRRCWYVHDPEKMEKAVHQKLAKYRLRNDREFFRVPFAIAVTEISSVVTDHECGIRTLDSLSGKKIPSNT